MSQVRQLCDKAYWLDHGKLQAYGEVNEICDQYEEYVKSLKK